VLHQDPQRALAVPQQKSTSALLDCTYAATRQKIYFDFLMHTKSMS
jgi:hypothetical protein